MNWWLWSVRCVTSSYDLLTFVEKWTKKKRNWSFHFHVRDFVNFLVENESEIDDNRGWMAACFRLMAREGARRWGIEYILSWQCLLRVSSLCRKNDLYEEKVSRKSSFATSWFWKCIFRVFVKARFVCGVLVLLYRIGSIQHSRHWMKWITVRL